MKTETQRQPQNMEWQPQPDAASLIYELLQSMVEQCSEAKAFADRLLHETGTRLIDWVCESSLNPAPDDTTANRIESVGYEHLEGTFRWRHAKGLFPEIVLDFDWKHPPRITIAVDSVVEFLAVHGLHGSSRIEGRPFSDCRTAKVFKSDDVEFHIAERHVWMPGAKRLRAKPMRLTRVEESFRLRRRSFESLEVAFDATSKLVGKAIKQVGVHRACDRFFAAERLYWMRRNLAARTQFARQQMLGMGWANHDHHTYRSSRAAFAPLIAIFEKLGFHCRERFYAGEEAGWGAQVLEQPAAGIVIFADVDLSPEEVAQDFAHEPLPPRDTLGTVGLWCRLHGESFFEAGMHHLECQFHFDEARRQLAEAGIPTMTPFTDMPHLKQAFTQGEVWQVDPQRIKKLLGDGLITEEQAAKFEREGAIGSHLEILERNDGYKGFNQTGISEIIRKTDPRTIGA